jgi:hypothetical protein
MTEHADGTGHDALLGVLAFASVGVPVARDLDAIHGRAHGAPAVRHSTEGSDRPERESHAEQSVAVDVVSN